MRATGCWLGSSRPPTRSSRAPPKPLPGAPSRRHAAGVSAARRRGCRRAWPSRRAAALAPCHVGRAGRGVVRPSGRASGSGWLTGREGRQLRSSYTPYRATPSVLYTLGAALLFLRLSRAHSNIHPPRVRPTRTGTAPHAPTPGTPADGDATRRDGSAGPREPNATRRPATADATATARIDTRSSSRYDTREGARPAPGTSPGTPRTPRRHCGSTSTPRRRLHQRLSLREGERLARAPRETVRRAARFVAGRPSCRHEIRERAPSGRVRVAENRAAAAREGTGRGTYPS